MHANCQASKQGKATEQALLVLSPLLLRIPILKMHRCLLAASLYCTSMYVCWFRYYDPCVRA